VKRKEGKGGVGEKKKREKRGKENRPSCGPWFKYPGFDENREGEEKKIKGKKKKIGKGKGGGKKCIDYPVPRRVARGRKRREKDIEKRKKKRRSRKKGERSAIPAKGGGVPE